MTVFTFEIRFAGNPPRRACARIMSSDGAMYVPAYEIAKVHLAPGHRDAALRWLQRAFDEKSHSMAFLKVDPQLRPLRGDKQFEALVARVSRRSE